MPRSLLSRLRSNYHQELLCNVVARRDGNGHLNIADRSSPASVAFAEGIISELNHQLASCPPTGQAAGSRFAEITRTYLAQSFDALGAIRPGTWGYSTTQVSHGIASFDQYAHLRELSEIMACNPEVKAVLGGDYYITPDIVIYRAALDDAELNADRKLVDASPVAEHSPLRRQNCRGIGLLHASISCKWTMRSDRAQNSRTEALNLIRNRKGRVPHIVVVTFEPLPSRLASIALGTGDVDCTYHVALPELLKVAEASNHTDARDLLRDMISGRRLRDISDLPLDLAI